MADLESFQTAVTEWFDDTVTRGKVWYRRNMLRVGIMASPKIVKRYFGGFSYSCNLIG